MSFKELFNNDSVEKQLNIVADATSYTNDDLCMEEMELSESLCSEENLRFGCCESSVFKIRVLNDTVSFKDKVLSAAMTLVEEGKAEYPLGQYKVYSDKPTADRRYRDIVAYDAMYDILHAEVSGWYNTILPTADSTVTLKAFRDSFLAYFGIEQEEVTLVNDSMIVTKTIEPTSLSGKTVITAICELNGCFGHIGRDGKFKYVFLQDTSLYPADTLYPADDLYPAGIDIPASCYIKAEYEDYTTALINKLQIRQEEDDIGCIYGTGDNCYIVQDNFLVYGKSSDELNVIAENLYTIISSVTYQPVHVEAKGNPCLEVGDAIELRTKNGVITSYILQRTLKGIQALRDTYDAEGEQYQKKNANGIREQIIQLKGKTNKLTRTVEETRLEIADLEKGLSSRITQNAEAISAEVTRAKAEEGRLSSLITQTAEQVRIEVREAKESAVNTAAQDATNKANSALTAANNNTANLLKSYSTTTEMNSIISAAADEIRMEVTARTSVYNEEINTLQGGMDGSIDLSFFTRDDGTAISTMSDKQCIYNGGYAFYQDVSIPAGTYKFSYEWLRSSGLFINACVELYDLATSYDEPIYSQDLGTAWLTTNVWTKNEFQFSLTKTSRVRFMSTFTAPIGYEDRVNSLYLTNIALYGTAQSVADSITDMKTELLLQQDQIQLRVEKNGVVSAINASSETITISASKIDLVGLVSATEFTSKYATITNLNAATAEISSLKTNKLSTSQFTAANINAMGIVAGSVAAENITGTTISGKTLIGGEIWSNNYVASSSAYTCGGGMRIDLASGNIWWANGCIKSTVGVIYSYGYDTFSTDSGYYVNHQNALALYSGNSNTLVLGGGFSSVILPSGAAVTSAVEKKENIIACANALSAVENTDVYYFNYKNDNVKRNAVQKVGFIIGDGYKLDPRLLAETGDAIDTYNAIGLNWRATQQLYEKVKTLQKQIGEILQTLANQEVV